MGTCLYCGEKAGLFRKVHPACEEKRKTGYGQMVTLAAAAVRTGQAWEALREHLRQIADTSYGLADWVPAALVAGWEQTLDSFLSDRVLSAEEESRLRQYASFFQLSPQDLDQHGAYTRAGMNAVLRDILEGKLPPRVQVEGTVR